MSMVSTCSSNGCSHNSGGKRSAGDITIGSVYPGCEAYEAGGHIAGRIYQEAFVGSCKMRNCKFNDDLECMAGIVLIGGGTDKATCITYTSG